MRVLGRFVRVSKRCIVSWFLGLSPTFQVGGPFRRRLAFVSRDIYRRRILAYAVTIPFDTAESNEINRTFEPRPIGVSSNDIEEVLHSTIASDQDFAPS